MAERDIIARLRLAGEEFSRELNDALGDVAPTAERAGNEAGERFSSGFGSKLGGLAIASAAAIGAAGEAIAKSLDYADSLDTSSRSLNVNAESLQLWRHAAREVGASAEELDASLDSLNGNIKSAHDGNRNAQQSFLDLGVGFETVNGNVRETDAVFRDVIERLSKIEDPSKRAEMAASVLGDEFDRLLPLAQGGAKGLDEVEAAARRLGVALTNDELKNLNDTNQKLADMRDILSVRIAGTVADNADAIIALADGMGYVAEKAAGAVRWYREFKLEQGLYLAKNTRDGWFTSDANKSVANQQIEQYQLQLARLRGQVDKSGSFRDYTLSPIAFGRPSDVSAPTVDPKPSRKTSGGSGRTAGKSEEQKAAEQAEREREAAIKRAWEQEKKLSSSVDETIQKQQDSVRVEQVRAGLGERAAAEEEARLKFEQEHPEAAAKTVAQLAVMLGITKDIVTANKTLTDEQKAQLQADINKLAVAKQGVVDTAGAKADAEAARAAREADEERWRAARQAQDKLDREQERSIRNIANLYEDLFTGGVGRVWKDFKSIGTRVIAEVAAKWTLATISGQSFNVGQALNTSVGQSPLGALFGSGRNLFGGSTGSANDNGASKAFQEAFGGMPGYTPGIMPGDQPTGKVGGVSAIMSGAGSVLGPLALASAANSMIGDVLGFKGGPLGIFTSLFDGILNPNRTANAHLTSISDVTIGGKDKKNYGTASGLGDSVVSGLQQIADALGADLGTFNTTIGVRGGDYRLNPNGTSLKIKNGAVNYGEDAEAAVAAAIQDAINDGVLLGVSQASQNILKSGQDLEAAITKAAAIESIPKLLKQRLDPLGAALDEVDAKYKELAATLKEGGASAEQITQARELWQMEREDTIKQIGDASATLKTFLSSLAVGSNSPLSLRQQEASARQALSPYTAQIEAAKSAQAALDQLKSSGGSAADIKAAEEAARVAAGKIDQEGFQEAAQALLGIERSINGSSSGFFAEFNQIKQLTSDAANLIDAVTTKSTEAATDPFSAAIAASTSDTANILYDQTKQLAEVVSQLQAVNDNLTSKKSWIDQIRGY